MLYNKIQLSSVPECDPIINYCINGLDKDPIIFIERIPHWNCDVHATYDFIFMYGTDGW